MDKKELKEWVNNLPEDFDNYQLVFRNIYLPENDNDIWFAKDTPIISLDVDENTQEICLFDNKSANLIEEINERINKDKETD